MTLGSGVLLLLAVLGISPLPKLEVRQAAVADDVAVPNSRPSSGPKLIPASLPAGGSSASAVEATLKGGGFPLVQSMLQLDKPLLHGEYAWNDEGVAPGPAWIVVDLSTQTIHAFRGDTEIGRAVVLYGADNKPTPVGRFTITQKKRHHVSNLYDAPMPYMMRLTNDGVAIHASFVEQDAATHGCIGVPEDFAELLFAEAKVGTPVLVVREGAFERVRPTA